ncbi:MAG TPA: folylpolyglutamate synthase/dihydrofolate synthase family protein [Acidobacteriaceae bacterium]
MALMPRTAEIATFEHAVESLYALGLELVSTPGKPRRKWELAHMRTLCAALGDPQNTFPSVLIAGTNGKGSTAATLASILRAAGYRTGLYTSPHLICVTERMQIGGAEIAKDDFARLYFRVDDTARQLVHDGALPHPPSFFEVLTAIAFCYFAEQHVQMAVLEVGLGGRLDATNIVEPQLSIIADIALDHTDYLGNTIAEIAREKAGILREHGTLVTLPQHPEANQALGERAVALEVTGVNAAEYMPVRGTEDEAALPGNHYPLVVMGEQITVDSPLSGPHQQRNLALAIAAAVTLAGRGLHISAQAIAEGIHATNWPGRLERIRNGGANFLLDSAHNPAAMWALRSALAQLPESQPKTLIFSCLRDKALAEMAQILFPLFDGKLDAVLIPPIATPRAAAMDEMMAAADVLDTRATACASIHEAMERARAVTPANGIIIVTGSIYLIGAVRAELQGAVCSGATS